jgi:hypothetical protein
MRKQTPGKLTTKLFVAATAITALLFGAGLLFGSPSAITAAAFIAVCALWHAVIAKTTHEVLG